MVMVPPSDRARNGDSWFSAIPLLAIPLLIYNIIAWGGQAVSSAEDIRERLREVWFSVPMPSAGVDWVISASDLLIAGSLILLFVEIVRAASSGRMAIINHALSIAVLIICLAEFLIFAPFATSVFFLITLMALLDVVAGFVISIIVARRDFSVEG